MSSIREIALAKAVGGNGGGGGIAVAANAGAHNSIYRGEYLGDAVTAAQYDAIDAGTFDDLFIGDYWTINGVNWRIAAFDYWYRCGDTECTTHHLVIVPDSNLLLGEEDITHWMNNTYTTTGAYIGSDFYTGNNSNTGKSQCINMVNSAFGAAHILSHREFFSNTVTDGYESAGSWYDSTVDMMNEQMVYGCRIYGNCLNASNLPNSNTIDKSQLPLFALAPSFICNRERWWLRNVVSGRNFASVANTGICTYFIALLTLPGVRPAFGICKANPAPQGD